MRPRQHWLRPERFGKGQLWRKLLVIAVPTVSTDVNRLAQRLADFHFMYGPGESQEGFTIWFDLIPKWVDREKARFACASAAARVLLKLARRPVGPGAFLRDKSLSPEVRSMAARSMLAMKGGYATAARMRALGFPNLVKAREALRRKAAERQCAIRR